MGPLPAPLHAAAQGNVLVVDAARGPGSTHRSINGAVFAAADGDMVLIRAGVYDEQVFLNDGQRSLVVAAEAGAKVEVEQFSVLGLQAGKRIVLRGFEAISNSVVGGVSTSGCRGQVWIEDYRTDAHLLNAPVKITDSDDVVLVRCRVEAGAGMRIERSTVALFDCSSTPRRSPPTGCGSTTPAYRSTAAASPAPMAPTRSRPCAPPSGPAATE